MKRGGKDRSRSKGKGMAGSREGGRGIPRSAPGAQRRNGTPRMPLGRREENLRPATRARKERRLPGAAMEEDGVDKPAGCGGRLVKPTAPVAAAEPGRLFSSERRQNVAAANPSSEEIGGIPGMAASRRAAEAYCGRGRAAKRRERSRPAAAQPPRREGSSARLFAPPHRGQEAALLQPRDTEGGGRGETSLSPPGGYCFIDPHLCVVMFGQVPPLLEATWCLPDGLQVNTPSTRFHTTPNPGSCSVWKAPLRFGI